MEVYVMKNRGVRFMKRNKQAGCAAAALALAMMFAACPIVIEGEDPPLKIAVTGIDSKYRGKLGYLLIFNDLGDEDDVAQCSGIIEYRSVGGSLYKHSLYGDWSAWTTQGAYYVKLEIYGNYDETLGTGPLEAVYVSKEKISLQSETPVKFSDLVLEPGH
jgi:hypothetical protein